MNSLEFIKQHVTEWPTTEYRSNVVWLTTDGDAIFHDSAIPPPYYRVNLSEHFAPSYYDGKTYTREEFESFGVVESEPTPNDGAKYEATIIGLCGTPVEIDIYRVLDAYPQVDPHIEHLIKKALKPGQRGHKDKRTDYLNIIESAQKALKLLDQKESLS